jgi:uncharacterized protein (DUF433 family)
MPVTSRHGCLVEQMRRNRPHSTTVHLSHLHAPKGRPRLTQSSWLRTLKGMDVHVSPELEEKLRALAASTGRHPEQVVEDAVRKYETAKLTALDWSRCAAVERSPERVSGAWVLRGTRMPVATIFENLEAGANLDDIVSWYDGLDRDQVRAVLDFAVRSLDASASDR